MKPLDQSWFYLDALNQSVGPVALAQIQSLRQNYDFFVWTEGMAGWVLASECLSTAGEVDIAESTSLPARKIKTPKKRKLGRSAKELMLLCRGIIADGKVSPEEIQMLNGWLKEHPEASAEWPANVLIERLGQVLADGAIDHSEQIDLFELLEKVTADPSAESIPTPNSNAVLYDVHLPEIEFEEQGFSFVGKFVYGALSRCKQSIRIRGGIPVTSPHDANTHYIVIGTFGAKGETLAEINDLRKARKQISIIPESHWHAALQRHDHQLISIYGSEDSTECGVIPLNKNEYSLPTIKKLFAVTVPIHSFTGGETYTVDLTRQTCTCMDFTERRQRFTVGDVRRACKHMCLAIAQKRIEMPMFLEDAIRNRVELQHGFPTGKWFEWCEVDGKKVFIGSNQGGWVNLFAPSFIRGKPGPYDEFGYSTIEERWAYGERPFRSKRLERFINEHSA